LAKVAIPDAKMVLEFKGPARQKITQEIPICNESTSDWQLNAVFNGSGFSGPKHLHIKKNETAVFEINFYSLLSGTYESNLTLRNADGDTFNYHLVGIAEDPLAEENLFFKCSSRKQEKLSIKLQRMQFKSTTTTTVNAGGSITKERQDLASKSHQKLTTVKYEVESVIP
jgi:hypothetical protein